MTKGFDQCRTGGRFIPGSFRPRILLQAMITFAAVSYHLELNTMIDYWGLQGLKATLWNLTESFDSFSFARFMLLPGFALLYTAIDRAWERDKDRTRSAGARETKRGPGFSVHFPASLFAVMMVLGWSFAHYNSWNQVLTIQYGQLIKSLVVFGGYEILFRYLIQFAYLKFALGFPGLTSFHPEKPKAFLWYKNILLKAPFRTVFVTLLILYLPLMIVSYPGLVVSDTVGQTAMAFPELEHTADYLDASQLIKPGVYLNNHHPVAHTMLLHFCLVAGHGLLNSWNAGYYLYSVLQEISLICVAAFLIREYIRKYGVSVWYAIGVMLYLFASPLIHNYVILNTKDVFYTLFLLLTVYFWYQVLTKGGRKNLMLLLLFATGVIIFRNEGQSVMMLAAAGSFFLNPGSRKKFAVVLLYMIVFSIGYFYLLFPALGITQGSRREILPVPFQQTARYVAEHGDQVTPEEREAIDAVLDYECIAEVYQPNLADPVKGLYREKEATQGDLIRYLACWMKMGLKQPLTYLAAFLNNKYMYFYPDKELMSLESYKRTGFLFTWITEVSEKVGIAPAQPEALSGLRDLADDMQSWLSLTMSTPLSVLLMTSLYSGITILLLCYSVRRRDRIMISLCLIPMMVLLACMAGPTNGDYSRYSFPLAMIWPFFVPIIHPSNRPEQNEAGVCGKMHTL